MAKKYPPTAHISLGTLREVAERKVRELNKAGQETEQKWDLSKYLRWLIRQDSKGEITRPKTAHAVPQSDQEGDSGYYDSLLSECYRR